MSREQLQKKIEKQKYLIQQEKRRNDRIEKEMLEMENEDHNDLKEIMSNINKEDVPDDMHILWEQQQKILKTTAKSQYRWHPR